MSLRREELEEEYESTVSSGLLCALVLHTAIALTGGIFWAALQSHDPKPLTIGYEGPTRILEDLEVLLPNSVESFFFQKQRAGQTRAEQFQVVNEIVIDPGPEPIPLPSRRPKPQAQQIESIDDAELLEPLLAFHKEVSYSTDFVVLKAVKPDYPEYERVREIEGQVTIMCYVTPEGKIEDERVTETIMDPPDASPRAFELAALGAVRQWQVIPPLVDGERHGVWMPIRIRFDLRDVERANSQLPPPEGP